jgi:hypothetical protein
MSDHLSPAETRRYHPKTIFRIYPMLFLAATVWLGFETWQRQDILWLIMFVGVGFITIRLILGAFAWASFDGETFIYKTPLRKSHKVQRGQLALVEMGGRKNEAIIVGYHPRREDGIIDLDAMTYINCVPLEDQNELYEHLLAAMPKTS